MRSISVLDRFYLGLFFTLVGLACHTDHTGKQDPFSLPYRPVPFEREEPDRFVKMAIPLDNPLTEAGVVLGRKLFFDPILSGDQTIGCASCHRSELAFADGRALSQGVKSNQTRRNSPSLINIGYQTNGLFWDGREKQLEQLVIHPVQDSSEMGNDWEVLLARLRSHQEYPALYRRAFGLRSREEINQERTAKALAQYLRTLVSKRSRYDLYKAGKLTLTAAEDRGRRIFFDIDDGLPVAECGHCHVEPLFSGLEYFNNGLDEVYQATDFTDPGRGAVSGRLGEIGTFRTPSLRNVAITAPYMHDGRFSTLEEVIDHYAQGGHYSENVHPNVHRLQLSEGDKADLIAFLNMLTDETYRKAFE